MGYYDYQNGLIYRHLNQEGGWDEHHDHCRSFILKALDLYKPEKITIIGSGWLLDLPIAEIAGKTKTVCLVDIIHPPEVIIQTGAFDNVELKELDITGGLIEEVWKRTRKYSFLNKLRSLDSITIPEDVTLNDPGMVVSLNILTQLESLLIDFIKKRSKIKEEDFDCFRAGIQKKHLDFLRKFNSVLITDTTEVIIDNSGKEAISPTIFAELPSGQFIEEWDWHFDLVRSDFYNKKSILKVVGIII